MSKVKKSKAALKVLKLMKKDRSWMQSVNIVLQKDKRLSKEKLLKEFNNYV